MMDGLNSNEHIKAEYGLDIKLFAITFTALKFRPNYIHFDWIHQYYIRRQRWMTYLFYPIYLLDVFLARRLLRVKLVWTRHNILPHDRPQGGLYLHARKYFAKNVDWIRVFSETSVKASGKVLSISRAKFKVIPEGDYMSYYENQVSRNEARAILGLGKEFVLLFFGSMRPYKGLEVLIRSFSQLRRSDWKLLVVGSCRDGKYLARLNRLKNNDVRIQILDKFVPKDEVGLYMNACDLVVLPFERVENSGSAILAMGFAKPVLAPYVGNLRFRLKQQSFLLYKEDLGTAFSILDIMDKCLLSSIGKDNQRALKKYRWEDFQRAFTE